MSQSLLLVLVKMTIVRYYFDAVRTIRVGLSGFEPISALREIVYKGIRNGSGRYSQAIRI